MCMYVFVYSGTVDDTELIDGFVFDQRTSGAGGPNKIEKAKIGLIQFCISPPKTDVRATASNDSYLQVILLQLASSASISFVWLYRWNTM